MGALAFFKDLYNVKTLDTRLVPSDEELLKNRGKASKPKWNSLEFYIYGLLFLIFVPIMILTAASAGSPSNINYRLFSSKLTPGWLGRPVDNTDMQYSGFRSQLPALALLSLVHSIVRKLIGAEVGCGRSIYDFVFGLLLIVGLHGTGAFKIFAILAINFYVGRKHQSRLVCWAFALGILFSNELLSGYPLPSFLEIGGLLPQWHVYFKCTMMRMLSYNIDFIEEISEANKSTSEISEISKKQNPELARICTPRPHTDYEFINYIGYCLYAPLYLAGPILTFNDFRVQVNNPLPSIRPDRILAYAIRFLVCLLCMEFILHYIPVVAIAETRAWIGLTPSQVSMIGFFNLVIIWLKLLLPWRFFRLWALFDKIDPPENMIRCVANNYSALSFWRSWHRSFHRWVVRYLYIPLGGSKHQLRNSVIVFAFVAIWHDIQLRLFVWSFLIVLFVIPEIVARALVPYKKYGKRKWYRYVAGMGAVGNIWMMLIANLVGFALGIDGIRALLHEMIHTASGLKLVIMCSALLFVGAQVMFEYREMELRSGINVKC